MWVLGINWKWHDGAAALVDGTGRVHALAEEERFTRVKHAWNSYPTEATSFCLQQAGIGWRDLTAVAIGWDLPQLIPWGDDDRERLYTALFGAEAAGGRGPELVFVPHHLAHARSAFHASGFEAAGVLVVDGAGERESISVYAADGSGLIARRQWPRAFSLGAMYEAGTRLIGLGNLNAGKTMGLASYGDQLDSVVLPTGDLLGGGAPAFDWPTQLPYDDFTGKWGEYLAGRFGAVTRPPELLDEDPVAVRVAASLQRTVEEAMRALHAETVCLTGQPAVCVAGGVALNCVANGRLPEPVYIPPFPHDAGVALGAAWSICPPAAPAPLQSPYLGRDLRLDGEPDRLRAAGYTVEPFRSGPVLDRLLAGQLGAVAEGRAEIGPRALGHRSIIALPRPVATRDRLNAVKGRESWRPLAPVVLSGHDRELWPDQGTRAWYMIGSTVVSARGRAELPAAVHVDGTTRPQVLRPGQAPALECLLTGLADAGLPPVLVNTSFNDAKEPIVDTAADAARTFMSLGLDFLVLGDCLVTRPAV
ncbi:carbamoyltransferase C-terminal domain-containing protein [Rugosimonospora africana]|uniref:Carbamoyltransferase n=1 Tax=Rugosimonospora africana TaxID=556532 RepID=A0A8J3QYA5_9ACTN|nr:carbamoyltransferase C-terminal domain-containing protein [Rugosimonospora africana]GIH19635.1 carbamoyltransferase [Rugosimonospora africana]